MSLVPLSAPSATGSVTDEERIRRVAEENARRAQEARSPRRRGRPTGALDVVTEVFEAFGAGRSRRQPDPPAATAPPRFCSYCASQLAEGSLECASCGAALQRES